MSFVWSRLFGRVVRRPAHLPKPRRHLRLEQLEDRTTPAFIGGVATAMADIDGDGVADIIAGAAEGGAPLVRIFSGANGSLIREFFAFDANNRGGVSVAVGDLNGDGTAEVIVGGGAGVGPLVRVFNGQTGQQLLEFRGIEDLSFSGGVRVSTGDLNGDNADDVLVVAGPGGGPRVAAFNGTSLKAANVPVKMFGDFFGLTDTSLRTGITVGSADVDGDGRDEILIGSGEGTGAVVRLFNSTRSLIREFTAFPGFNGGVSVAGTDANGDGKDEIAVAAGPGGAPIVRILDGTTGQEVRSFTAYDSNFRGGVLLSTGFVSSTKVETIVTGPATSGGPDVRGFNAATGQQFFGFLAFDTSAGNFNVLGKSTVPPPPPPPGTPGANMPQVSDGINDLAVAQNATPTTIDLSQAFSDADVVGTRIRFNTNFGPIEVDMFDDRTPLTVNNFLSYINRGAYDESIFHRLVPGFVLQGGGFTFSGGQLPPIATDPPVLNEPGISNKRGTIAMAKLGGNPNSATSQFFFNLADNSANLDVQNGGFTVFGQIVSGQDIVDRFAAITPQNADNGGVFAQIPLIDYTVTPNFPSDTIRANYSILSGVNIVRTSDQLTYTVVSNTNPSLVTPAIAGRNLTLTYAPNQTGTATLTIRATDKAGQSVDTTFTIRVN